MHAIGFPAWVNVAGSVVFLTLAVLVWRLGRREPANRAFVLFLAAYAFAVALGNLFVRPGDAWEIPYAAAGLLYLIAGLGLALVARVFPVALSAQDRPVLLVAGLVLAVEFLAVMTHTALVDSTRSAAEWIWRFNRLSLHLFLGALWAFLVLLAWHHRRAGDARTRSIALLMAAGLALWPAYYTGALLIAVFYTVPRPAIILAALCVPPLIAAAAWLTQARKGARGPVFIAWLVLGLMLVGLIVGVNIRGESGNWGYGLIRLLMVLLFAYAILRHQILGIDLKVRWGVSRSVVAGAFVAVFFLVSELTQLFFETRLGGLTRVDPAVIGVIAAALLLFAITPLQRLADRLAAGAVPIVASGTEDARGAYRDAVLLALSDDRIDRADERALARLAKACGLDPEEAWRVRDEVEADRAPPPARATEDQGRAP
jgi:hypothetical protein